VSFASLPSQAAWQHRGVRSGFEVVFFSHQDSRWRIQGCTTAKEDGRPWAVEYAIELDHAGATRRARTTGRSVAGSCSTMLDADGHDHWLVDGKGVPQLDGCLDADLESSAMTNAFPVRRLGLAVAGRAVVPAVYVRAVGDYTAPAFDYQCRLVYDRSGLVIDYPGIAVRTG
jgi:uncharacterized protein